jgi:hypothetical protein
MRGDSILWVICTGTLVQHEPPFVHKLAQQIEIWESAEGQVQKEKTITAAFFKGIISFGSPSSRVFRK